MGSVVLDQQGLLDDPDYIHGARQRANPVSPNVAPLSVNVVASLLAQYVSFGVAPCGLGDPGPLQYVLSTHHLERLDDTVRPHCPIEAAEVVGDARVCLTGAHEDAERKRRLSSLVGTGVRVLRCLDGGADRVATGWTGGHGLDSSGCRVGLQEWDAKRRSVRRSFGWSVIDFVRVREAAPRSESQRSSRNQERTGCE